MKKLLSLMLAITMSAAFIAGCSNSGTDNTPPASDSGQTEVGGGEGGTTEPEPEPQPEPDWLDTASESVKDNLTAGGYIGGKISDFSKYAGTEAYRVVTTADELVTAVKDAVWHYKSEWNGEGQPITQDPDEGYTEENFKGKVHVIEVAADIDLGYNKLSEQAKNSGVIENIVSTKTVKDENGNVVPAYTNTSMVEEYGISSLKIQHINDLLIYSKNGAKITHASMNVMASSNVAFRNLEFDEIWQWEDTQTVKTNKIGDYDSQKWAYFKISFCGYVWIDHCTFGKASDGLIDYSNPVSNATEGMVAMPMNRNPYGLTDERGVHISWCNFKGGSDDKHGYIYKMMEEIEANYQANKADSSVKCKYLYYKALRDANYSFEDIFYALAVPQKKAFLCGDSGNNKEDYEYNRKLDISIANCYFKSIEDRIPKLRGGNGYIYNCIVDNFQYYTYRAKLNGAQAAINRAGGSKWKCALVSQCLLCSNGGSLKAESCIFKGINTLLKNNDEVKDTDAQRNKGYYQIVNCLYQKTESGNGVRGSSTDTPNPFTVGGGALYTDGFAWHTKDGKQPFTISAVSVDNLEVFLNDENYGVGARTAMGEKCLKSEY